MYSMYRDSDLYYYPWPHQPMAELKGDYLFVCENNLCTALLLYKLYSFSYWAKEKSQGDEDDYHDPAIYNTVEGITKWFMGVFGAHEIEQSINYLEGKGYITVWRRGSDLTIECVLTRVDEDCKAFKTIRYPIPIHSEKVCLERAHEREEEDKDWQQVDATQITKGKEHEPSPLEVEAQKVKYHNTRARRVQLPATLTLEQWAQTLDHFEWKCAYCRGKYDMLEHFIPLSHGFGTAWDNCVPACSSCNTTKQAWHPLQSWGPNMPHMKEGIDRVQTYLATRR